jgi:hypothetical protein
MNTNSIDTYVARIYIAGDYDKARDICRKFCYDVGFCVNVTKNTYIYTGGEEDGVIVECINYPRFPSTKDEIDGNAYELALFLREQLCQDSFTLVTSDKTLWVSSRDS